MLMGKTVHATFFSSTGSIPAMASSDQDAIFNVRSANLNALVSLGFVCLQSCTQSYSTVDNSRMTAVCLEGLWRGTAECSLSYAHGPDSDRVATSSSSKTNVWISLSLGVGFLFVGLTIYVKRHRKFVSFHCHYCRRKALSVVEWTQLLTCFQNW